MSKPPYRVPSMAEIAALPPNGYRVASTFSGCGGSSLGYRMAGFKVVWANEFIPAARASYAANAPTTPLDGRDIRDVHGEDIFAATGLAEGELDLLDGSPPCASFSSAGKLEAHWGKVKTYSQTRQRTDDLFFEFARLVSEVQPRVFVAENVAGLVRGVAKGTFLRVLAAFKAIGYEVEARVLDASWLGVPQTRVRLIFVGVRSDLGARPAFPSPLPYRYSIRDALPEIDALQDGVWHNRWLQSHQPAPPAVATRAVDVITKRGRRSLDAPAPTLQTHGNAHTHSEFTLGVAAPLLIDPESDIAPFAIAKEWDKLAEGESSKRYYNLVKPRASDPCPTITAAGASSTGTATVAHPFERRKFAISELKRICAFPDDFLLVGTYQQQWERLGRAVPPVMMAAIASAIRDRVLDPLRRQEAV